MADEATERNDLRAEVLQSKLRLELMGIELECLRREVTEMRQEVWELKRETKGAISRMEKELATLRQRAGWVTKLSLN